MYFGSKRNLFKVVGKRFVVVKKIRIIKDKINILWGNNRKGDLREFEEVGRFYLLRFRSVKLKI